MKKILLLSFVLMFGTYNLFAESMTVSGAGTTAANGVYERDGDYFGRPCYKKGSLYLYCYTYQYWMIGDTRGYDVDAGGISRVYYWIDYGSGGAPTTPDGITFNLLGTITGVSEPFPTVSATVETEATVTTQSVSNITTTTATGNGNVTVTGGVNITERGIYYSTTNGFADGEGTKVSATGDWSVIPFYVLIFS